MSYPGHLLARRSLTPLQRCSQCILQPQQTGLPDSWTLLLWQHTTTSYKTRKSSSDFCLWRWVSSKSKIWVRLRTLWMTFICINYKLMCVCVYFKILSPLKPLKTFLFKAIQFSQTVIIQTIQLSRSMQFSPI